MHRLLPNAAVTMDDWVIDIWFTGLKTGKVIHKTACASPFAHKELAIRLALKLYRINEPYRIKDIKIERRRTVTLNEWRDMPQDQMTQLIEKYVKT